MGSEQDSAEKEIAQLRDQLAETTLQKNKHQEENVKLHSRIIELNTENQWHQAKVNIYKERLGTSTSQAIEFEVSKGSLQQEYDVAINLAKLHQGNLEGQLTVVKNQLTVLEEKNAADEGLRKQVLRKLEQDHDAAVVLANQKQDDLEGQLRSVQKVNQHLTDQVRVLEEKNAADEGLRKQVLRKLEQNHELHLHILSKQREEFAFFLNVKLTNSVNVNLTRTSGVAAASDHSYAALEDGQQELALVDDGPSTSAGAMAMAAQTRKRVDKSLVGNSGGSKRRRETDDSTNGLTEDVTADDEIVVKIEGHEVESGSEGDGLDLNTAVFGNDKIMSNILKHLPSKQLPTIRQSEDEMDDIVVKIEEVEVEVERDDDRTPLENTESEADQVDLSTKVFGNDKIEGVEVEHDDDDEGAPLEETDFEGEGVDLSTQVFANDKIMSNVLKYLPRKQLPKLRLTCKTWNTEIIKQLKFHIRDFSFTDDCVSNLFATCGKYITHLKITLEDQNVFTLSDFRNLIFNLAPALEDLTLVDNRGSSSGMWTHGTTWVEENQTNPRPLALKRLTLQPTFCTDLCRTRFTQFLIKVFNFAMNLEHIEIAEKPHCPWYNLNLGILHAIKKLRSLANLKSLILKELCNEELELLILLSARKENSLKLTSFDTACVSRTLKNFGSYDIGAKLDKFLKRQSKSLEKLTIGCNYKRKIGPGPSRLSIKLPKLDKLNQLSIYLDVSHYDQEFIKFVSTNICPNLKTFEFIIQGNGSLDHSDWMEYIHHPEEPHVGVQVLRVTIDQDSSETRLSHLATLFPNVRHLTAWLDDTPQLAQMWDKWTRLESLHISFRYDQCLVAKDLGGLDEYLTGIPTKEHEALKLKVVSGLNLAELDLDLDLTNLTTKLGLANLKNLRELTLDFTCLNLFGSASAFIGDISVYFGLARLSKLRTLQILPAQLISPVCRAALSHVLES